MIETIINYFFSFLKDTNNWIYLLGFFAALLESIFIIGYIISGSTIIFIIGGILAFQNSFDFFQMMIFIFSGAFIGDNLSYFLGKKIGKKWSEQGFWIVKSEYFKKAYLFFEKNGRKSIIIGRIMPLTKESTSFIAGSSNINYFKFLFYIIIGIFLWILEFFGLGFFAGGSFMIAEFWFDRISFLIFSVILFFFIFFLIKKIIERYWKKILKNIKNYFYILEKIFFSEEFIKKNNKKIIFLKERFSIKNFWGIPFTILLSLFLYYFVSFFGFSRNFLNAKNMIEIDGRISKLVILFKDNLFLDLSFWISNLSENIIILVFWFTSSLILFYYRKIKEIFVLLILILFTKFFVFCSRFFLSGYNIEQIFNINYNPFNPDTNLSLAIVFYGFISWILIRNTKKIKKMINIFFLFIGLILIIFVSRIYLGLQYFSDQLVSVSLGGMILIVGIILLEYLYKIEKRKKIKKEIVNRVIEIKKNKKYIIYFLLFSNFLIFVIFGKIYEEKIIKKNINIDNNKIVNIKNVKNFFDKHKHLKFTETIFGNETEPINFIFLASNDKEIENIFLQSGWNKSDKITIDSIIKMLKNLIGTMKYKTAPITPLFWNGNIQKFSFQILPNNRNLRKRHHIRIWKTNFRINKKYIYVGSATFDERIKWLVTHKISKNIDLEREIVFETLKFFIKNKYQKIQLVKSMSGKNFSGDTFVTDGYVYIIEI